MTGAAGGGAFKGMSAACAAPPSTTAAITPIPSQKSFRIGCPHFGLCSPPLQAQWIQPYRKSGQRTVTGEQRQVVFCILSTEYLKYDWYYLNDRGIIWPVIVLSYTQVWS